MTIVDITPAKRRFGIKPRKQWQFRITHTNGNNLSTQDTYANAPDIVSMLRNFRSDPVTVRIHYDNGVQEFLL